MKVQSLAVIFAIIILPIIIILSYYIHSEVDTIAKQTSYDTKLLDATHDAMSAFELNTANEDLSSVSDALRSIIEASTNVFFNSMATNLGMSNASRDYVQPYIPAILYTLYDGYYIYSPTRVPEVLTHNGDTVVNVGDGGVTNDGQITTDTGKLIGKYRYSGDESYVKNGNPSIYNNIASNNKYEYGQMLYKNNDGSYSTELHGVNDGSDNGTFYKQDYILKSYMPYSARYSGKSGEKNFDLTINYTLDNYITIVGNIDKIYYSKTGYLIAKDTLLQSDITGLDDDILSRNEIDAENIILSGEHEIEVKINPFLEDGVTRVTDNGGEKIKLRYTIKEDDGQPLSYSEQKDKLKRLYEEIENLYTEYRINPEENSGNLDEIAIKNQEVQEYEYSLENLGAIAYYVKSQIFSNWVYDNLGIDGLGIKESDIKDDLAKLNNDNYTTELSSDANAPVFHYDFSSSNAIIFDKNHNPENLDSKFVSHKFDVIRNSIQYNLNLSLSIYDKMASEMDIKMPVILDSEWEKILQNVSIVSFMQGFNCGLKYYNNYAIVSSTNNEITVIPNELYYVKKDEYNTEDIDDIYHRIDCEYLEDTSDLISFKSKEVKYDKIYNKDSGKYKYDHKNFACYNCIVGSNYLKNIYDKDGNQVLGYSGNIFPSILSYNHKVAYYRAIAKARETVYKTNALTDSSGFEEVYNNPYNNVSFINLTTSDSLEKIRAIELTVGGVNSNNADDIPIGVKVLLNNRYDIDVSYYLKIQESAQTLIIPVNIHDSQKLSSIRFNKDDPTNNINKSNILNVRVIYE